MIGRDSPDEELPHLTDAPCYNFPPSNDDVLHDHHTDVLIGRKVSVKKEILNKYAELANNRSLEENIYFSVPQNQVEQEENILKASENQEEDETIIEPDFDDNWVDGIIIDEKKQSNEEHNIYTIEIEGDSPLELRKYIYRNGCLNLERLEHLDD